MTSPLAAFGRTHVVARSTAPLTTSQHAPAQVVAAQRMSALAMRSTRIVIGAALCVAIGVVVSPCPQEQMLRIEARPDIAPVQNALILGNRADKHLPRHSVDELSEVSAVRNGAVPIPGLQAAGPKPTPADVVYAPFGEESAARVLWFPAHTAK